MSAFDVEAAKKRGAMIADADVRRDLDANIAFALEVSQRRDIPPHIASLVGTLANRLQVLLDVASELPAVLTELDDQVVMLKISRSNHEHTAGILIAERAQTDALVAALPRCFDCGQIDKSIAGVGVRRYGFGHWCDRHTKPEHEDARWAAPVRAILASRAALKGGTP